MRVYPSKEEVLRFFDSAPSSFILVRSHGNSVSVQGRPDSDPIRLQTATDAIKKLFDAMEKPLPDVNIVMTYGDGPENSSPVAMERNRRFVFENSCKKNEDCLLSPMWFFYRESDIQEVLANTTPWESKRQQAVWRGSTTGFTNPLLRAAIVEAGDKRPDLLDAGFTQIVQEAEKRPEVRDKKLKSHLSPVQQAENYRYIVVVDGNTSTYGLYWALASGSLVLLCSRYKMWFTPFFCKEVEPNRLLAEIERAKQDDAGSHKLAIQARAEAKRLFTPKAVSAHFRKLLLHVEKQQRNAVAPEKENLSGLFKKNYERMQLTSTQIWLVVLTTIIILFVVTTFLVISILK